MCSGILTKLSSVPRSPGRGVGVPAPQEQIVINRVLPSIPHHITIERPSSESTHRQGSQKIIAARRTGLLYTYKFKCWCMGLTSGVVIQNFKFAVHKKDFTWECSFSS